MVGERIVRYDRAMITAEQRRMDAEVFQGSPFHHDLGGA